MRLEAVRVHREYAGLEAFRKALYPGAVARRAQRNEQRQKMLVARMCARRLGRLLAPGDERIDVMRDQPIMQPFGERLCVTQRLLPASGSTSTL